MKKEHLIVVFYILYFSWLFSIIYLLQHQKILDYFTAFIALFYFVFLRETHDFIYFILGTSIVTIIALVSLSGGVFYIGGILLEQIPLWLPLSWGTTFVALHKFYHTIQDK